MNIELAREVKKTGMPDPPELRTLSEKEAELAAKNFELDRWIAQLETRKLEGIHAFMRMIKKLQAEKKKILEELEEINQPLPLFDAAAEVEARRQTRVADQAVAALGIAPAPGPEEEITVPSHREP